jgi:hypothetical protein
VGKSLRLCLGIALVAAVCALCLGAAQARATPAAAQAAATTQSSPFASIASFILENVASTLVGDATDAALGQLLSAVGAGDDTGAQLQAISDKLNEIDTKLNQLGDQVSQVLSAVQQGTCTGLSGQLDQTRSKIDVAWNQYTALAKSKLPKARRRAQARSLLSYLDTQLDYQAAEVEIHNKLVVPGAGAEGLIASCGKAIQSRGSILRTRLWGSVKQVLDFWQAYEAKLLVLEVEALDAHKGRAGAKHALASLKSGLRAERKALRPEVPAGVFVDQTTSLVWTKNPPFAKTYDQATADAKKQKPQHGQAWRIPTVAEFQGLATDCCGTAVGQLTGSLAPLYPAMTKAAGVSWNAVPGFIGSANSAKLAVVLDGFSNASNCNCGGFVLLVRNLGRGERYSY